MPHPRHPPGLWPPQLPPRLPLHSLHSVYTPNDEISMSNSAATMEPCLSVEKVSPAIWLESRISPTAEAAATCASAVHGCKQGGHQPGAHFPGSFSAATCPAAARRCQCIQFVQEHDSRCSCLCSRKHALHPRSHTGKGHLSREMQIRRHGDRSKLALYMARHSLELA